MIKIIARRIIRPECIERFQALAQELAACSRSEAGNVSYTLNQSTSDPRLHVFLEIWQDQDAISAHNQTEHFTRIVPQFAELTLERLPVELYTELN